MPKLIRETTISASTVLGPTSRYADMNILIYGDNHIQTLPSYERIRTYPRSEDDRYYQITLRSQYRPDLVALDAYGDPNLWWIIAEANNLFDIEDWYVGRTLRIPPNSVILSMTSEGTTSTE